MAGRFNTTLDQGADFGFMLRLWTDAAKTVALDLTDYSGKMQIRKRKTDPEVAWEGSTDTSGVSFGVSPANGEVSVTIPNTVTSELSEGIYFYDILLTDPNDKISRIIEGEIRVLGSVTRD